MDTALQAAIIGALFTLSAAILASLVNYYRERSERERWQRTLEFEQKKQSYERIRWALDLNNQREIELHKMRLRTYPAVLETLERLSGHYINKLSEEEIRGLADKFNAFGYGEAGLCMLPDTRDAVFALRKDLIRLAGKEIDAKSLRAGSRTDLIELLRRDVNHDWSRWRDFQTLTEVNQERVSKILAATEQTSPEKPQ